MTFVLFIFHRPCKNGKEKRTLNLNMMFIHNIPIHLVRYSREGASRWCHVLFEKNPNTSNPWIKTATRRRLFDICIHVYGLQCRKITLNIRIQISVLYSFRERENTRRVRSLFVFIFDVHSQLMKWYYNHIVKAAELIAQLIVNQQLRVRVCNLRIIIRF